MRATAGELIPWLVAQLSIGQFYNPQFLRGFGTGVLNGSLWMIPVELQFYLFLPLCYALLRRVRAKNVALICLIVVFAGAHYLYATLGVERTLAVKFLGVSLLPYGRQHENDDPDDGFPGQEPGDPAGIALQEHPEQKEI